MKYELSIQNKDKVYEPITEGEIKWETNRKGSPGKLTFNVVKDDYIDFQEGNLVRLKVNDMEVFYGFIFAKNRNKDQVISVTAYDQIRYLKNKDTYKYVKKKANELIKMIADDFGLQTGTLADTAYVIPKRIEENKTLLDIIYTALDLTMVNTNKAYVFYDQYGKLTLQDVETIKVPIVIGDETAEDFSYQTDIDTDTYNKVKLAKKDEKKGETKVYIVQDSNNINNWGVLQYYQTVGDDLNAAQIKRQADMLIEMKNRKNRVLQLKKCIGDIRIRAGNSVIVILKGVGDVNISQYLLVEKCVHIFSNAEHWMTLDVRGNIG